MPGGLAESTGLLSVNDEVIEVNGIEVSGKTLDQVTDMMVANSSNLIITVKPTNQRYNLNRHPNNMSSNSTLGSSKTTHAMIASSQKEFYQNQASSNHLNNRSFSFNKNKTNETKTNNNITYQANEFGSKTKLGTEDNSSISASSSINSSFTSNLNKNDKSSTISKHLNNQPNENGQHDGQVILDFLNCKVSNSPPKKENDIKNGNENIL